MNSQVGEDMGASEEYGDTVLVVAGDFATRQSLASVLASAEIETYGAEPDEALATQALYHPAIALVEHAPVLHDGLALAARLKERDPDIGVLLLTDPAFLASAQPSELVDQYLVKPLATAAFIQTVRNALTRRGLMIAYRSLADRVEQGHVEESEQIDSEAPDTEPAAFPPLRLHPAPVEEVSVEEPPVEEPPLEEVPVAELPVEESPVAVAPDGAGLLEDHPLRVAHAVPEPRVEQETAAALAESATAEHRDERAMFEPAPIVLHDQLRQALTLSSTARRSAAVLLVCVELPVGYGLSWEHQGAAIGTWVSERLAGRGRRSDQVVAVDSGSFVMVCLDADSAAAAEAIASAVSKELSRPLSIGEESIPLGVTIGIVLTDGEQEGALSPEELLEDAWIAARAASAEGRPWALFDSSVGEGARLREGLLRAMDNGDLDLDFQKVVDLQTTRVVGAEAYLRWRRSGSQTLCAGEFLDKAYEAGMAATLGKWVMDRALTELASWRAGSALAENFKLFVNVGAPELAVPEYAEMVEKLLRGHGVPSTMLAIEMPESALGDAVADVNALRALRSLGALGVDCVVDDFGTGRSNLDWLHELPVTGLKINPELVSVLDHSEDRRGPALVRGVIALGHELQMTVVGEGVESVSQEVALRAMGCDLAQGHHLGRPERSGQLASALV